MSRENNEKDLSPEERNIAQFQEQMEKERESNSHADTYNKLKSGGKLTEEEIEYLQKHDPEALAKYREAQAEKKAYENELKNCKTKDEVQPIIDQLVEYGYLAEKTGAKQQGRGRTPLGVYVVNPYVFEME